MAAKTFQRSVRLDVGLKPHMRSLPAGTTNSLINELLAGFFQNPVLQADILGRLADRRFRDWKALLVTPKIRKPELKKGADNWNKFAEVEEPAPINDIMPGR